MEKIKSFCINHDRLKRGLYISRIDEGIITYDLRMVKPNNGTYLDNDGLHTFEHLFATYARNSRFSKSVIYAGPMGCRTGFYLLVRDCLSREDAITLVQETIRFIKDFNGPIPGASESKECGNYKDHDLDKAKSYAKDYLEVIKDWEVGQLTYPNR